MGKVKEKDVAFQKENYFGILDHNGSLKVAKTPIRANILYINKNKNNEFVDVLVKGNKGSYVAKIHKNLKKDMIFVEKGDCAWIKWKNGNAWMVGFQKRKAYNNEKAQERFISSNGEMDWNSFFRGVDVE